MRLILLLLVFLLVGCRSEIVREIGPNELMYFIMTDRFADGDTSNNVDVDKTDLKRYHGGDFAGLRSRLDYLEDLGVTMVWITPVQKNTPDGYHGYWIDDFYAIEPHLGSLEELKALVQDLHRRDMLLIVDFVVNHTGYDSTILQEHPDWFHPDKGIHNWNDRQQVEQGWLAGLPDLNQQIPEVRDYLIESALWLIQETGIDGFRLDTVRHVEPAFWQTFTDRIRQDYPNFYFLGEVYDYNASVLNYYKQSGIEGMLNYPLYRGILDGLHDGGSMKGLAEAMMWADKDPSPTKNGVFFDNHDNPRLLSLIGEGAPEYVNQALTFVMTSRQIPVIYYGSEVSMEGGKDPDNRRDFPWNTPDNTLEPLWSTLRDLRKDPIYQNGTWELIEVSDEIIVYQIQSDDGRFVIGLNNRNYPVQSTLLDLTDLKAYGDSSQEVTAEIPPRGIMIYRSK